MRGFVRNFIKFDLEVRRILLEDVRTSFFHLLLNFPSDWGEIVDDLEQTGIEAFEGEAAEEGGEKIDADDDEIEDDKPFERVVVSEAGPILKYPGVGLLFEVLVLDNKPRQIYSQLLRHNL